jgi:hypothetical protein
MRIARARHPSTRLLTAVMWALLAYVAVQSVAPVLDHDLVCHLKSRTHCTACGSGVFTPGLTATAVAAPAPHLPCAGTMDRDVERTMSVPASGATDYRAPPA